MPTFQYTLSAGSFPRGPLGGGGVGPQGVITIVTEDVPIAVQEQNGIFQGYSITGISGTFDGQTITGLSGPSGQLYNSGDGGHSSVNTIFINSTEGAGASSFNGFDGNGIAFTTNTTVYHLFSAALPYQGTGIGYTVGNSLTIQPTVFYGTTYAPTYPVPVCFASGTGIRTARGDVAVEDLQVGDLAVTGSGAQRPIRWIGSQRFDCRRHLRPESVLPVRIAAGSLGAERPVRDLRVSPGHALCLDMLGEVLIPAAALVNGSTITQGSVDDVTYWHVELDSHDLLVAEGVPVESYLDMANRGFFGRDADGPDTVIDIAAGPDPDASMRTHADFCRPFHDRGTLVDAARMQLQARARTLGWTLVDRDTWADVSLEVDGTVVRPTVSGLSACFTLPAGAQDIRLACPTGVPSRLGESTDPRSLGLCLTGLSLTDGFGTRPVPLDSPLLQSGFHTPAADHRWTTGRVHLPAALLDGMNGDVFLRLDLGAPALPCWVAPQSAVPNATPHLPDRVTATA